MLAVLPSTSRIDLVRLSEVVGEPASHVRLATPDELFELFPDCEPGVVPPFGRLYGLKTVVDSGLADSPEIIVGANTRHEGLRMLFRDFQTLEEPVRASFTRPLVARARAAKADPSRDETVARVGDSDEPADGSPRCSRMRSARSFISSTS